MRASSSCCPALSRTDVTSGRSRIPHWQGMKLDKEPTGPKITFSYRCQEPLCCLAVRICAAGPSWSYRRMCKSPPSHTDQPKPPLSLPRRAGTLRHLLRCLIWSTVIKRFTVLGAGLALAQMPMPGPKASPAAACPAAGQSASISDFHPHPRSGATGRTGSLPWLGLSCPLGQETPGTLIELPGAWLALGQQASGWSLKRQPRAPRPGSTTTSPQPHTKKPHTGRWH